MTNSREMLQDHSIPEQVQKPLKHRIYDYLKKHGPADIREIAEGGSRTGYITEKPSVSADRLIVEAIYELVNSGILEFTDQQRVRVVPKTQE